MLDMDNRIINNFDMSSISPRVRHARLRELLVPAHLLASKEGLIF